MVLKRKRSKTLKKGKGRRRIVKPWDELPNDILENIMTKVHYADQMSIRRVCKKWNVRGKFPSVKQSPWLIYFANNYSWSSLRMINPNNKKKIYDVKIEDRRLCRKSLEDVHIHECKKGWLLMSKVKLIETNVHSFFLFSPFFTCEIMQLPTMRSSFKLASFSSNPRDEHCVFFALDSTHPSSNTVVINTCTKKDKKWSKLRFECDPYDFCSVVYIEQESSFYCLAKNGSIGIYNITEQSWRVEHYKVKWLSRRNETQVLPHPRLIQPYGYILMVQVAPKSTDCNVWNVPDYAVYKLDKQSSKWKRLDDMKSEVFFFGGCGATVPATWGSNTSVPITSGGNTTSRGKKTSRGKRVFYSSATKIKHFEFSDIRRYCDSRSHSCQVCYGPSVVKFGESGRMTFIEAPES